MKKIFLFAALFCTVFTFAQEAHVAESGKAAENWFNLDRSTDKVYGVSTERTYNELLKGKKSKTVIVGVIDSGVDYTHEDLKDVMWVNEKEIPDNNIDDDKNGYVDDIHGWNFMGGKDGKSYENETLELTRLYRKLKPKYDGKSEKEIASIDKNEYKSYQLYKIEFEKMYGETQQQFVQIKYVFDMFEGLNLDIKDQLTITEVTVKQLDIYRPKDKQQEQIVPYLKAMLAENKVDSISLDDIIQELDKSVDYLEKRLKYNLNVDYNPRGIVGDDIENPNEKGYGNKDCIGVGSLHGTHVAGIIAANRNNNLGMKGVANDVKIMALRAVPSGDERDKDIANAIYYAVDNGAQVINMSFGKAFSQDKSIVDKAVKYAEMKGVLLVHAAGNDAVNNDQKEHFPTRKFENSKKEAKNWIEVGALNWRDGEQLPAPFSNYGKKSVDVFAPGVDIYSTKNGGGYIDESGTSMACPVVAGVAAVLRSYFPDLSAEQIKKIIIKSSIKDQKSSKVRRPGGTELVPFSDLSNSGGIVNLYEAVKMAMTMTKIKS